MRRCKQCKHLRCLFPARLPVLEDEMVMWVSPLTPETGSQGTECRCLRDEHTWGCSISAPAWLEKNLSAAGLNPVFISNKGANVQSL